ncbi:unnamed protein product [Blepharisma stoltei]|uniref:LAGLIDADG homing endonuclease n=1 Tax=Blepharisma stoltei TaxID=1481888 RepID=A0AAU9JEX4_9CILI|nr:unnamed protein product [Blepharisma stoltei]
MGNPMSGYCSYSDKPKKIIARRTFFNSFTDGTVKIIDYTGVMGYSQTLSDMKHKMRSIIPYEIRRIKDNSIDERHSIVKVAGIKQDGDMFIEFTFDIIFSSLGKFNISIAQSKSPLLNDAKCNGVLELYYTFPKDTIFKRDFKDFFEWLEKNKNNPYSILKGEGDNMGRVIYAYFRSMGIKDEKNNLN